MFLPTHARARFARLTLAVACALAADGAFAAEADADTLDTVVVTGLRTEIQDFTPESSKQHSQTITRTQIEQLRPRDVFELLNNATGVIATNGSRKGFSGLRIRGDSNFRWIIDGTVLQPTMASRILRSMPVMAIEEVKIVRGGTALTLGPMVGSASPGGAPVDGFVMIRTRRPTEDQASARLAVESFDGVQGSVWAGKTLKPGDHEAYVAGLASYSHTNGPDDALDNGVGYNLGRDSLGGMAKAGFRTERWWVDAMAYHDEGSFEIPNANSHGTGQGDWYMDPSRTSIYAVNGAKEWSPSQTTSFGASYTESHQRLWTANTPAGPYNVVRNDNRTTAFNLRHTLEIAGARAVLGFDYQHWTAPNGQQYYEGIRREEKTTGWFAQAERGFFEDKLTLDAGYRRDRVHVLHGLSYYTGGAQPYGGVNSPLRTRDIDQPPAAFQSYGASWKFSDDWRASVRYAASRQASESLNPVPGITLQDDRQRKWEIGVEGRVVRWFNPSLNLFRRQVENEKTLSGYTYLANNGSSQICRLATIPASGPLSPRPPATLTPCYNQADTTRGGFELSVQGDFLERSSYRASVTRFTTLSTNAAPTTPRQMVDLSFAHGFGAFTLTGAMKHLSAYRGSASDASAYLGGYTSYDLGLGYDFEMSGHPLRTTLYGRNLSDRHYETNNGVQDPGRVIGVEFLARF